MPKGCAHIASTKSTECSIPRNQGTQLDSQSMDLFIEFIYICSTGVSTIGRNNSKVCFMVQILHRNLWEILPSQKQIN